MIRLLLTLAAAIAIGAPGTSGAEPLVISAGQNGGYYDAVGKRLQVVITSELGEVSEVIQSEGSTQNLARLDDDESPVSIAFTQEDALGHYLKDHPDFEEEYVLLIEIGDECAFLIAPRDEGIRTASDLQADGDRTVAVGDAASGAAVTWERLSRLDPRFRNSPAENLNIIEALLDLKAQNRRSKVAAALVVQRPIAISVPIEIVMEHPDVYRFVPIRRAEVRITDGDARQSGYRFENVTLGFGRDYRQRFETLCTRGLMLASKNKLGNQRLAKIAHALSGSLHYIVPGLR